MTRRLALTALAASALLVTACGGDDEPARTVVVTQPAPAPAPTQTAPPTTAAPAPTQAAPGPVPSSVDEADAPRVAEASTLQLADLPSGFRAVPPPPEQPSRCDAIREARAAAAARETSEQFARGQSGVEQTVYVFSDEAAAREAFEAISSNETTGCIRRTLNRRVASRARNAEVQTQSGSLNATVTGSDAAGTEFVITVESGGRRARVTIDALYVRTGPVLSLLLVSAEDEAIDAQAREQALEGSANRARAALTSTG